MPKRKFSVKIDPFKSGGHNEDKNTDGSAGFGIFFETPVSSEQVVGQKLGPHLTIFQVEAMVITKACKAVSAVVAEEGMPNTVPIYRDSQSVLQALNSRWITFKTVWE